MMKIVLAALSCLCVTAFSAETPVWKKENIGSICKGSRATEIEVGKDGTVHLAWTGCGQRRRRGGDGDGSHLFYAKKEKGGNWEQRVIDESNNDVGRFPALGIDSKGGVHIAYKDHINWDLKYAYLAPGTRSVEPQVISKKESGSWTSGVMHNDVFYVTHTHYQAKYHKEPRLAMHTLKDGKWTQEFLQDYDGGWNTNVTIDANGNPIVVSHSGAYFRGHIKLTYKENGQWKDFAIGGPATREQIKIDSKGFAHIVYGRSDPEDGRLDDVIYATNSPDGVWKKETVSGHEGKDEDAFFPSIAVDKNDRVHIAFRDYLRNQLKYARKINDKWEISLLDTMGRPLYSSMTVDEDNNLHIAYESADQLVYGFCDTCTL